MTMPTVHLSNKSGKILDLEYNGPARIATTSGDIIFLEDGSARDAPIFDRLRTAQNQKINDEKSLAEAQKTIDEVNSRRISTPEEQH